MSSVDTFLVLLIAWIALPTLAYFCVKLGTAGYLRARQRNREQEKRKSAEPTKTTNEGE